jgi:hypothetical protein
MNIEECTSKIELVRIAQSEIMHLSMLPYKDDGAFYVGRYQKVTMLKISCPAPN